MAVHDKLKMTLLLFFYCITCTLVSCQNKNTNEQHNNQVNIHNIVSSDSIKNQFIELADAIKNNDCDKLKIFFTFPIYNQYIWYKVLPEDKLDSENILNPFTERDFEKYCKILFDINIKQTIETLNLDKISFPNENFESDTIIVQGNIYLNKCVLLISFNNKGLVLSILSNLHNENNEFLSEHIDKYYFTISNNKLLFSNFEMID